MPNVDQVFLDLARTPLAATAIIACLYTGRDLPSRCAPMARRPYPSCGMPFDHDFSAVLARALAQNPAVHDGAIMIGRPNISERFRITGWSYRLYPEAIGGPTDVNRGSAFNSCLAMSAVPGIDRLYLTSSTITVRFVAGTFEYLLG